MRTWRVPVVWQMMGVVEVVADSLTEAMEIAKDPGGDIPLPDNGSYLDESWELATEDEGLIRECYNGSMPDTD